MNTRFAVLALVSVGCTATPLDALDDAWLHDAASTLPPTVEAAPPALGQERPATLAREFTCLADQVGAEMTVGGIAGRPGDAVVIRPAGSDCRFQLVYRAASGHESALSDAPNGYLFTAGRADGAAPIVCTNEIEHVPAGGDQRRTGRVTIRCARETDGVWGPLVDVVAPDGAYAAWLRSVDPGPDARYAVVTWQRDFSYSVLNMTDAGRPPEDGIYTTTVDLTTAVPVAVATRKVTSVSNPLAGSHFEQWKPTEAEKQAYADYIDFDEGPCANGCEADPGAALTPTLPTVSPAGGILR